MYFKDEAAAAKKLAELAKQQKKEGQAGLDVPLELRVMAVKAAERLAPFRVRFSVTFLLSHDCRDSAAHPGPPDLDQFASWCRRAPADFQVALLRLHDTHYHDRPGRLLAPDSLGFRINPEDQVEVAPQSLQRFKDEVRELWRSCQSLTSVELRERWCAFVLNVAGPRESKEPAS